MRIDKGLYKDPIFRAIVKELAPLKKEILAASEDELDKILSGPHRPPPGHMTSEQKERARIESAYRFHYTLHVIQRFCLVT